MNEISEIKERINLLDYLSKNYKVINLRTASPGIDPCPICGHNGCFKISKKNNMWKCFSCGDGGDIFNFLEKAENKNFPEALQILAKEAGIELDNKKIKKEYESREKIREIFECATEYYHKIFLKTPKAIDYIKKERKRNDRFIKKTRYGFSDGQLNKHLVKKGFSKKDILASGLAKESTNTDKKFMYDFFKRGLFIYPVFYRGKVVDFFCKDYLNKNKEKKSEYQVPKKHKLNNPQFYGKDAINAEAFILTEGAEDRLSILQHYDIPVCAILGQPSRDQIDFLKKHSLDSTIYMAMDHDAAGEKFADKIKKELCGIAHVRQLIWDSEIKDLDEWVKTQKQQGNAIKALLDASEDIIIYDINNLNIPIDEPLIKQRMAKPIIDMIAIIPGEISRVNYMENLALKMGGKTQNFPAIKSMVNKMLGIDASIGKKEEEKPVNGIFIRYGKYFYAKGEHTTQISNFIMEINQVIEEEEERFYEVKLINDKGMHSPKFLINAEDQVNFRKYRVACKKRGPYRYTGDDHQLSEIFQIEEENVEIPLTLYFRRYGWISRHKTWLFANCAIQGGKVYKTDAGGIVRIGNVGYVSKNVNVYSNDAPVINTEFKITEKWIHQCILDFWTMWDHRPKAKTVELGKKIKEYQSFKGFLNIAYVAAMAYRPEWIKFDRKFPNLFSFGPVQTGKSEAIQLMMNCFGFHHEGNPWKASTAVGITYSLEHLSALPLWMEEYTNSKVNDKKQEGKIEIIRAAYNLSSPTKGNINRMTVVNEVNTSFVFSGQDFLTDKASQTRTIGLRKERPTDEGSEAFRNLVSSRDKLSSIFLWLLQNKTKESTAEMLENFEAVKAEIKKRVKAKKGMITDRKLINYSMMISSFAHFGYHEYDNEFINWLVEDSVSSRMRENEADIVHQFFNDIEVIYATNIDTVIQVHDDIVYLRFHQIYNDWVINANRLMSRELLSESMLRDYLRHDPAGYWHEMGKDNRQYFAIHQERQTDKKRFQAIALKIDLLPPEIKDIVESW